MADDAKKGRSTASSSSTTRRQSFQGSLDPSANPSSPEALSPADAKPRRPGQNRRASSKQLPYRGQGFSADDASQEIEEAESQYHQARKATGSLSRRQMSTIRRRPTAQTPRLPFIESAEGDDDDDDNVEELPSTASLPRKDSVPSGSELRRQRTYEAAQETEGGQEDDHENDDDNGGDDAAMEDDDDADLSDAESFTLKDRQEAINETHPFGIRIWKPALYKKGRSVEKDAEGDIHSTPGGHVSNWLLFFNFAWTLIFGWWLAVLAGIGGLLCHLFAFAPGCQEYGRVLWGLARYIFYPFGKYVKLILEEDYAQEDEGEGRSISEYERWQQGDLEEGRLFFGPVRSLVGRRRSQDDSDDETSSLLGRNGGTGSPADGNHTKTKRRLFGRGQWNLGRVIFFVFFYGLLTPLLFLVSLICWLLVFTVPMGRVTLILLRHLRKRPLALEFHSDSTYTRGQGTAPSAIILCTYRAVGTRYWKYTVDGTNIFLINLLGVVAFVIFDYWVLYVALGLRIALTNTIFVFLLSLFSIIPLAYFIGQAVASISAQSSMGVGAAINAFFSTIVEVFLYCVALNEGKAALVEGSLIGSIFAGILLLPGISMCFGAIKRKTQRFNVRSAGVTSTMLLFAVIGSFSPTLFYQIYGAHEMSCHQCTDETGTPLDRDCRRCFFTQVPAVHDPFFLNAVRPYTWFAAVLLFLSYIIGLLFTLRTHAATIWNSELDEKKAEKADIAKRLGPPAHAPKTGTFGYGTTASKASSLDGKVPATKAPATPANTLSRNDIRDSHLYKRLLATSLQQAGIANEDNRSSKSPDAAEREAGSKDGLISKDDETRRMTSLRVAGLSDEDNTALVRHMAEMAATAAAVAARDATQNPKKASVLSRTSSTVPQQVADREREQRMTASQTLRGPAPQESLTAEAAQAAGEIAAGGHDAPNWGRFKSYTVLLSATVAYAVIAEILVSTVDAVLSNVDIDEKFLGITLFALVPNTTEFLNAISFAMNGNIALSMEIGSAYALQVCLLQIPAIVLFSAVHGQFIDPTDVIDHTFTLLFPQWDMVTVILCVFLLSYMYGEGKSNYFKGSILILSYLVVVVGFYLTGLSESIDTNPNGEPTMQGVGDVRERYRTMGGKGSHWR